MTAALSYPLGAAVAADAANYATGGSTSLHFSLEKMPPVPEPVRLPVAPAATQVVTRYCFGEVWERPHLDRKMRRLLTLAMLVVLGLQNELKVHVRGERSNGATVEEIREVLLYAMIYAGVPAAVAGFRSAAEVLAELGLA